MTNEKNVPSTHSGPNHVSASNRSVAVGGKASNNVIVTGDHVVMGDVSIEQFRAELKTLRTSVAESRLDAEERAIIEAEIVDVEKQTAKEKPSKPLILGKLETIANVAKAAGEVGSKLVPAARWLGEMAAGLF